MKSNLHRILVWLMLVAVRFSQLCDELEQV